MGKKAPKLMLIKCTIKLLSITLIAETLKSK